MLSEKLQSALNEQINRELYSAYLYLSMNAYFKSVNLDGFVNWMQVQAQEELTHAMKFYAFINQRGGRVVLGPVEAPTVEWTDTLAVFGDTLTHEQGVTERINRLMDLALAEKDHATTIFLQWFVTEQVEEEESVGLVLEQLRRLKGDQNGLFMLDRDLAARQFTPPQQGA